MDNSQDSSGVLFNLNSLLNPYIKPRQEVTRIRRILRLHLSSYLQTEDLQPLNQPFSLPNITHCVEYLPQRLKGLQGEYLRHLNTNFKVGEEYTQLSIEHRASHENLFDTGVSNAIHHGEALSTESFIDLEKKRDRHKRLCIIQSYLETLSLRPAASIDYLDPADLFRDLKDLPMVPIEVMQPTSIDRASTELSMKELIPKLEKSILRAKMNLAKEQKLLLKVRAAKSNSNTRQSSRLSALSTARNELIKWIETELARTNDLSISIGQSDQDDFKYQGEISSTVASNLISIQKQYADYVDARRSLLACIKQNSEALAFEPIQPLSYSETNAPLLSSSATQLLYPYLEELVAFSNEQKSFVQQKTYLKSNLAKQLSESSQGFDRLAQESHLLPAHPLSPTENIRKDTNKFATFIDDRSNDEKQDLSRLMEAWVFATQASNLKTTQLVLEKLEEGGLSMLEVHNHLLQLQRLPGFRKLDSVNEESNNTWESIHGNLGAMKGDLSKTN